MSIIDQITDRDVERLVSLLMAGSKTVRLIADRSGLDEADDAIRGCDLLAKRFDQEAALWVSLAGSRDDESRWFSLKSVAEKLNNPKSDELPRHYGQERAVAQ